MKDRHEPRLNGSGRHAAHYFYRDFYRAVKLEDDFLPSEALR
jgi:hypothetical protein